MATDRKIKSKEEIAADSELEDLFKDIDGTLIVRVERLEPEYAEGYCGKFNVTAGKPLTLEQVKTRFGGRTFKLVARNSGGHYKQQKVISISGLPKDEGRVINLDGSLQPIGETDQNKGERKESSPQYHGNTNGFESLDALANMPISPKAKQVIIKEMFGFGDEETKKDQSTVDMMNMQNMMEFQQRMRDADLQYKKTLREMEHNDAMWRRDMAQQEKPKDTLSGMNDLVKVFRDMNGLKEEIGSSGNESVANTLISNTMPMIETMLAEFMKLKQMQIQMEVGRNNTPQLGSTSPPELPTRQPQPAQASPLRVVSDDDDPIAMARKMGSIFQKMPDDQKQQIMDAFFQGDQNVEPISYDDTIEDDEQGDDQDMILDAADREMLNGSQNQQDENGNVSDSEHARSTHDNDPTDRAGNQEGISIPAD